MNLGETGMLIRYHLGWGDYIYSMEPSSGTGYVAYKDILTKYAPA